MRSVNPRMAYVQLRISVEISCSRIPTSVVQGPSALPSASFAAGRVARTGRMRSTRPCITALNSSRCLAMISSCSVISPQRRGHSEPPESCSATTVRFKPPNPRDIPIRSLADRNVSLYACALMRACGSSKLCDIFSFQTLYCGSSYRIPLMIRSYLSPSIKRNSSSVQKECAGRNQLRIRVISS